MLITCLWYSTRNGSSSLTMNKIYDQFLALTQDMQMVIGLNQWSCGSSDQCIVKKQGKKLPS